MDCMYFGYNEVTLKAYLCISHLGHNEGLVISSKEGLYMDTITLKWCTPKSNTVGEFREKFHLQWMGLS